MRTIAIAFVFMVLLAFNAHGGDVTTYENPDFDFTVKYSSSWDAEVMNSQAVFISPLEGRQDVYREYVSIGSIDISGYPITLDQYVDASVKNWQEYAEGLKKVEQGNTKLRGERAIYIICEKETSRYKQFYFIENKKAYVLTYASTKEDFDKHLKEAEKIIKSVKVTD